MSTEQPRSKPLQGQAHPNGYYVQTLKQPQPGILPPVESQSGFVVVHLKEGFDVREVSDAIAAYPSVWNPPYTNSNDVDPVRDTYPPDPSKMPPPPPESVLVHAGRVANRYSPTTLYCNIGIGTHLYSTLFPDRNPPVNMAHFNSREYVSADDRHWFPYTGGDLFLHVKSSRTDLILDVILYFKQRLEGQLAPDGFKERYTFTSIDGRNQFGFFDAGSDARVTANPVLNSGPVCQAYPYPEDYEYNIPESLKDICCQDSIEKKKAARDKGLYVDLGRLATAFIGAEDPEHLNGSFCIVQEYIHDLDKFNRLSEQEQNVVFGRRKDNGAFIESQTNPLDGGINSDYPRAHIVRAHIRETGENGEADMDPCIQNVPGASLAPLQIFRQAASFGSATGERGLYFVAYCRYTETFELILSRMIGHDITWPGSSHDVDHLLEFTGARTGQFFYMPNLEELSSLAHFPLAR